MFMSNRPMCTKISNCSFLLPDVCSLRMLLKDTYCRLARSSPLPARSPPPPPTPAVHYEFMRFPVAIVQLRQTVHPAWLQFSCSCVCQLFIPSQVLSTKLIVRSMPKGPSKEVILPYPRAVMTRRRHMDTCSTDETGLDFIRAGEF